MAPKTSHAATPNAEENARYNVNSRCLNRCFMGLSIVWSEKHSRIRLLGPRRGLAGNYAMGDAMKSRIRFTASPKILPKRGAPDADPIPRPWENHGSATGKTWRFSDPLSRAHRLHSHSMGRFLFYPASTKHGLDQVRQQDRERQSVGAPYVGGVTAHLKEFGHCFLLPIFGMVRGIRSRRREFMPPEIRPFLPRRRE